MSRSNGTPVAMSAQILVSNLYFQYKEPVLEEMLGEMVGSRKYARNVQQESGTSHGNRKLEIFKEPKNAQ